MFQPGCGPVRVALVCPYAWDDPGGVQVHVRELAERPASRGHEVGRARARRGTRRRAVGARGRAAGRPHVQPLERADRPAAVVASGACATRSARSGPTSSTCTSRSRRARRCGPRSRRDAPVVATFHSGAERVAAVRPRRAVSCAGSRAGSPCGSPCREAAARVRRGARLGGTFEIVPERRRTSSGSPTPSRPTSGRARSCCSSAGSTSARGSRSPSPRSGGWRAERPDLRLVVAGDGPRATRR